MMTTFQIPEITQMFQQLADRLDKLEASMKGSFCQPNHPRFFTRAQTAEVLGISIRSVDYLIEQGKLETRREGPRKGKVMVSVESIGQHQASKGISREYINERLMEVAYGS